MLLDVEDLSISFPLDSGRAHAVRSLSFCLAEGEALGVVGESGCGKSVVNLALMGLLPPQAGLSASRLNFRGENMLSFREHHWQKFRGGSIAMIFQDPMTALNPSFTVRDQLMQAIFMHRPDLSRAARQSRAAQLLEQVGIPDPQKRLDSYPHQLSGGMAQRVVIALALACEPSLLIADEPTTALDVTIQAQILDLLDSLRRERKMAMILVTHDLAVAASHCDRIQVMYAGEIVESAPTRELIENPVHPYTRGLLKSLPGLKRGGFRSRLYSIPGRVPPLDKRPDGCVFFDRCELAQSSCRAMPAVMRMPGNGEHQVRCFYPKGEAL